MTLEIISGVIIKKIEEQCNGIIKEITNRQASKNLHQIEIWVKQQINSEFLTDNVQLLAIIIDTTHQYFKKESDKDKKNLIENCLANLINKSSNLSKEEIQEIACHLKIYNNIDDVDAQTALKEFIAKSGASTSFLGDLSKKLVSSCEKSLSQISNTIKTEFKSLSAVELTTEAGLPNQPSFFKDVSLGKFTNNLTKNRKKVKVRIIEFDKNGIGYDFFYMKNKKEMLQKELREESQKKLFRKELENLAKIEVNEDSYLIKQERKIKIFEFDLFASQEEKSLRQCSIDQKARNYKKGRERKKFSKLLVPKILYILKIIDIYKKTSDSQLLSTEFPLFETSEDKFLAAFLKTINYEKFKELIKFSEYIVVSIDKIRETLKKIDDFSEDLGVVSNKADFLDDCYRTIKEKFCRETISNFLENAVILFEQRTLALDNNYCLLERPSKKDQAVFSEPAFLDKFIADNNSKKIYEILSDEIKQFLNKRENIISRNKNFKNKTSLFKKFLSFFSEEYFFSKKFKKKFIKKIFSNFYKPISIETMKSILDNLKWRQFFFFHIGVLFLLRKRSRARLSEELFLDLLEEKFNKIDEKKEANAKDIDELYAIKKYINSLKSKTQDHLIDLSSLSILDSRQAIICKLKSHKEIKHLLDNVVFDLSSSALNCINEFNNLKDACRRESEKVPENGETFQLNKNDVSKLHIPLKWVR